MNEPEIETLLKEFARTNVHSDDAELAAVEAAMFIEESLGVTLSDDEISAETLGTPDAVRRMVATKRGM